MSTTRLFHSTAVKFAIGLVILSFPATCGARGTVIDPVYVQIPRGEIRHAIVSNEHDLAGMLLVLRRCCRQGDGGVAHQSLSEVAAHDPTNTCVLQGMYMLETIAAGFYWINGGLRVTDISAADVNDRVDRFAKILASDPKPWLALIIRGQGEFGFGQYVQGYTDVVSAVRMAPNSAFAHDVLSMVYGAPYTPYTDFAKSAAEDHTALRLDPRFSEAAMGLFDLYAGVLNDHAEALKWKAVVLSLVPSEAALSPGARTILSRYK